MDAVTKALEEIAQYRAGPCGTDHDKRPVIVIDDLGAGDAHWLQGPEGRFCLARLLQVKNVPLFIIVNSMIPFFDFRRDSPSRMQWACNGHGCGLKLGVWDYAIRCDCVRSETDPLSHPAHTACPWTIPPALPCRSVPRLEERSNVS